LATAGHEGILRIFDLTNEPNKQPPMQIVMDANTKINIGKCNWLSDTVLLTGCADGVVRFWDITGPTAPTAPANTLQTSDGAEIRDMEVTRNVGALGRDILTVAAGQKVYFFDLKDHSLVHVYKMPIHFLHEGGASLHPSGKTFVAGGSDLWVRVFDFDTGKELECLKGHHGPVRCLRYSPDGKTYASGSEDGTIRLWKTEA
jgi:serine-threonine kinase receptor-associated protein